jgi:mannose-1-phosphate guanylyltransferase
VAAPGTALVLAAGLGTRLRPLTAQVAKPALPVAGRALIERSLAWLRDGGVDDVIVNLHYRPETIAAILGDGTGHGVRIRYSWEQPVLGSAGGPRRAFSLVDQDRLWLINGDTLSDVDLDAMARRHDAEGALVTMAVIPNPDPDRYGGVLLDEAGAVTGFTPRGTAGPSWHFIGVQLAEREAFASLADGLPAESVAGLYPRLMATRPGCVSAYRCTAGFHDIGTPADYLDACLHFADIGGGSLVSPGATVDSRASVERTVLWDDVEVDAGANLRECIVMSGARIPSGFAAVRSVVSADLALTALC